MAKKKVYESYCDGSHGYLRVPYADITALGVEPRISHYSKRHGDLAFLEEDRDAGVFIEAMQKAGTPFDIKWNSCATSYCRTIRGFASFKWIPPIADAKSAVEFCRRSASLGNDVSEMVFSVIDTNDCAHLRAKDVDAECLASGCTDPITFIDEKYVRHSLVAFKFSKCRYYLCTDAVRKTCLELLGITLDEFKKLCSLETAKKEAA